MSVPEGSGGAGGAAGVAGQPTGKGGTSGGTGGSTGTGGNTIGVIGKVAWPPIERSKIDMLFMIDNSSSMADKQAILAAAVPALLERFINPACRNSETKEISPRPAGGECPEGSLPEFSPPTDMHIGVIDSSIGAFGLPKTCDDAYDTSAGVTDPHNNDQARLLTRGLSSAPSDGFLSWATGADNAKLASDFTSMVFGVGQHGCGYEASLESVYRFLIDPDPPAEVKVTQDSSGRQIASISGVDETLLQQRAAFLRPDSVVLVVLFSDEDDCSIKQDGQAWLSLAPYNNAHKSVLRPGTGKCLEDPNDKCCFNCGQTSQIPEGCPDPKSDSACSYPDGGARSYAAEEDPVNLRCWRQKQRYGIDMLYPISRYVDGFQQPKIRNRAGELVTNPLFPLPSNCSDDNCESLRDIGSVLMTAVVGVPWQDLSRDANDIGKGYKSSKQLEDSKVWDVVLGNPTASPPVAPTDPLMIDSVKPRTAEHTGNPLGSSALPAGTDSAAGANPVNGHEWNTSKTSPQPGADLQYACIFDLPPGKEKDCSKGSGDCDCVDFKDAGGPTPEEYRNPLCQGESGKYTTTQLRAKAYPGLRQLQLARDLGPQALAASICPADLKSEPTSPTYGYNPIIDLIVELIAPHLSNAR